jgi:hypothetical protein
LIFDWAMNMPVRRLMKPAKDDVGAFRDGAEVGAGYRAPVKLRFAGAQRRHAHRTAAHLDKLDFEAVLAEVALFLGDVDRRLALAHRAAGEKDFGQGGGGMEYVCRRCDNEEAE